MESRNQGLDHEQGWKQIHASWFPMQWGTIPMFRLLIFVDTLYVANRRHSGLLPASYMQRNEIRKHVVILRPSVPQTPTPLDRKLIVGYQHLHSVST